MKKEIIKKGLEFGLNLYVVVDRTDFDIFNYEVYSEGDFIGIYQYFTGKTSSGIDYPNTSIIKDIEKDINKYLLNK